MSDQSKDDLFPEVVKGRVANIDADFIAYQVACETKDELDGIKPRRTLEQMKQQVLNKAKYQMRLCGATSYVLFITPSASDKGGRNSQAVTKPYQANRSGRDKPEHLDAIRAYMGEDCISNISLYQEADDALAQANYTAIAEGTPELSVLCSMDKDLKMVPGYYFDYDDGVVKSIDDLFGYVEMYQPEQKATAKNKPAKKIRGRGTKFFWAQTLMGDTVDNIAGLPSYEQGGKTKKLGPAAAVKLLEGCDTDLQCFDRVRELYAGSKHEWVHWETQQPTTWGAALLGDMQLLWMRRTVEDRVSDFIIETLDENVPWKQ